MNKVAIAALLAVFLPSLACAPRAMRGGEGTANPGMDAPAMSTGLDKRDIDYLVAKNLEALYASPFWLHEVSVRPQPPVVAIWPIENGTSEHLDDQMTWFLSAIETSLINTGKVQVVARSRQEQLAQEIGIQQGATYDGSKAARLGRQLGASIFFTGKLTSIDERIQSTRRVQYSLFMQVLEIETGLVKFQFQTDRSKALKK